MTRPDRELIAQVMLFSQGFRTAESLASKIVPFFNLCDEQLSPQPHYDFGLRALKAVLASAGILKRERLQEEEAAEGASLSDTVSEQVILIQSVTETIVPKLVADDVPLLTRHVLLIRHVNLILSLYQPTCRRFPWHRIRTGRPECSPREDQRSMRRKTIGPGRTMDIKDSATLSDSKDPAWFYDGWPLRKWQDERLECPSVGARKVGWHRGGFICD